MPANKPERLLFLTGRLARPRLEKVLAGVKSDAFTCEVRDIGVKVAALMTEALIRRRLEPPMEADRVILPGRCRADLEGLSEAYGVTFQRGPEELKDLPGFLGQKGGPPDLSRHDVRIFAEIVEAPGLDVPAILERAETYRRAGADVIDIGGLPDTPFPHLEETIQELVRQGYEVSVDSADRDELRRGAAAGAAWMLSLTEQTLDLAEETGATPILIPAEHGDLASLERAMTALEKKGRRYLVDPVLDPIHFGFTESIGRYAEVRRRWPEVEILMGTGNLTELTEADTSGITAMLMGIISELEIRNVLIVQVSPHTRRTVEEHDAARRIMFASREDATIPKGYGSLLLGLHDRKPFPNTAEEIAETAAEITDANYRIEVAEDGIHVYNRDGHHVAQEAMALYPKLGVENDGSHAFYLGYELMKAELAFKLGKRFAQDEPLNWGVALPEPKGEDATRFKEAGETLKAARKERRKSKGKAPGKSRARTRSS